MVHAISLLRSNAAVKMLTEQEVVDLTKISTSTLQQHRFLGKGIPYFKVAGRCGMRSRTS